MLIKIINPSFTFLTKSDWKKYNTQFYSFLRLWYNIFNTMILQFINSTNVIHFLICFSRLDIFTVIITYLMITSL